MYVGRLLSLGLLLLAFGVAGHADDKNNNDLKITDQLFRQTSSLLLDDPLNRSARDWSRLVLLYTLQTTNPAEVALGPEEWRWIGLEKDDPRSVLLLAAYVSGNIRSQLNSGVKRNDRYSGLLALFRVYRALRAENKVFKVADIDNFLVLHADNKLIPYLQKLDEKGPAKMTPVEEKMIHKLMRKR